MHIEGPFRSFLILLHSRIFFSVPFFLSFLSKKCEIYTLKPLCIQAGIPFYPAYKNSHIIPPKLSIKEEFITRRTGISCLQYYLLISYVSSSSFLSYLLCLSVLTTRIRTICSCSSFGKNTRLHSQVSVPGVLICHYRNHLENREQS